MDKVSDRFIRWLTGEGPNVANRANLIAVVYSQIPRDLQDKIILDVEADAYLISTTVVVKDKQGREFKSPLEETEIEGVPVRCKVPDHFLSLLCVSIV